MEGGTDPTPEHSEGIATLGMDVSDLGRKEGALQEIRPLTDTTPALREGIQSLDRKIEDARERMFFHGMLDSTQMGEAVAAMDLPAPSSQR